MVAVLVERSNECCVLATSSDLAEPRLLALEQKYPSQFSVIKVDGFNDHRYLRFKFSVFDRLSSLFHNVSIWKRYRHAYDVVNKTHDIQRVIVPNGDIILPTLWLLKSPFRKKPMYLIVMRAWFLYLSGAASWAKKCLLLFQKFYTRKALRSSYVGLCLTNDPYFFRYASECWFAAKESSRIALLPDPPSGACNLGCEEEVVWGLDKNKFIILIAGVIGERKGVERAVNMALESNGQVQLVIAGKHNKNMSRKLAQLDSDSILRVDRYISDNELAYLFGVCNAVWVAYENFYSMSGVMVDAIFFGKPVIAPPVGALSQAVQDNKVGIVLTEGDKSFSSTMIKDLRQVKEDMILDGWATRFLCQHSTEQFSEIFRRSLSGN